jgi:hypothetical protein
MAEALRVPPAHLTVELLNSVASRADGPSAFRVMDASGKSRAVLLCSAPAYPDMVERAMLRAAQARLTLAPAEAAAILTPLLQGRMLDLSFSMLRYCQPLSTRRPLSWLQRAALRPRLLDWLYKVTTHTVAAADASQREAKFVAPLERLASMAQLGAPTRAAARRATQRLVDGSWQPRHVLMHGDLWKGNVLIDHPLPEIGRTHWRDRFVIVDWPGSELQGHAMYDLVRLSMSLRLGQAPLSAEVARHCAAVGADAEDAVSYLLSALGYIALHLEQFPLEKFAAMAQACLGHLQQVQINTDRKH